jgi:hypothetical protein
VVQSKSAAASIHKVKEIHFRTPHLVFPTAGLKPLSVAISNIAACAGATLLLQEEVIALGKFVKEHDPTGKITRAAVKKDNARKAEEMMTAEWGSQDADVILTHVKLVEHGTMRERAESEVASELAQEVADLQAEELESRIGSLRKPIIVWDDSDQ